METNFRLGFVVNPYAGVGGAVANKGSDDQAIQEKAKSGQLPLVAPQRSIIFLQYLHSLLEKNKQVTLVTVNGMMGSDYVDRKHFCLETIHFTPSINTQREDTQQTVQALCRSRVDLLVFVGGDGTARDVCRANDSSQVVIGVPSGVKMHSGVFAVNPQMAAELVAMLIKGDLVGLQLQEVRDIDEDAFRRGIVKSRYFGEMLVPQEVRYLQNVKQGGLEVEELVLNDIADQLKNQLPENVLIIMGPGSTTLGIQKNWDLDGTLLGVDLILNELLLVKDAAESDILDWLERHSGPTVLVITVIGGQGHIIGRGNQQISSKVLRKIGRENVIIVATKTKLKTLHGRPFMVDTGDRYLDEEWSGYIPVITGFADTVLYKVGY